MSRPEFIALMAMMTANIAFSIDAMLPGLPQIGAELSPAAPTLSGAVILAFVLGMGVGTLFAGPASDAVGRKPVIYVSSVVFCAGSLLAWVAPTLEALLAARVLQGLGAAGPRVAVMAIIRDRYEGAQMARIQSFVMMIFALVPAAAPLVGAQIMAVAGWRTIFLAFVGFAVIFTVWAALRLPESLTPEARRPVSVPRLRLTFAEVLGHRAVMTAVAVQTLGFGMLFGTLTTVQPVFDQTFGLAESFPLWFGVVALISVTASMLNAAVVVRLGMERIVRAVCSAQAVFSLTCAVAWLSGAVPEGALFWLFLAWMTSVFYQAAPIIGNVNALAMQPMGHIAGTAATVITCLATVGGALVAAPIGLAFDGTPVPAMLGVALAAAVARALMATLPTAVTAR